MKNGRARRLSFAIAGTIFAIGGLHFEAAGGHPPESIVWWTTHSLEKIRPTDPTPKSPQHAVTLWSARNEFESFQVVLRAQQKEVADIDVSMTDLVGPSTISSKDYVTIYLEHYIHLAEPSSIEGEAGEWPDALIPRIDRYAGQKRNAFPLTLSDQRNQPIWVDVYVPNNAPAGEYKSELSITVGGTSYATVPVSLKVWNFALPSTSTLKTTFGFNGGKAMKAHLGKYTNDADLYHLVHDYQKAALLHRISIHGGSMVPPRIPAGSSSINWSDFDAEMGPFLDGSALGQKGPLPGAKATSADLRIPPQLTPDQERPYYREWIRHFREKGWLSRLFYYLWDEPPTKDYPKVAAKGLASHKAEPEVKNLVTVALNGEMQNIVDIWVPLINCLESKQGFPPYCEQSAPLSAYKTELAKGKQLWWYQSCASHGCNSRGGEYFRGWPSYMIDTSAVSNRIFQWLAWKYGIEGELYFSMDEAFGKDNGEGSDPWDDVFLFGGNGDGTLFYPGRPNRIGGASDIPIESIRLKLIRDGLQDYEYLALCQKRGLTDLARASVNALALNLYQWDRRPESMYAIRRRLGDAISARQ